MEKKKVCEFCGANTASVTVVEIIEGEKIVRNLCKTCAEKVSMAIPEKEAVFKKKKVPQKMPSGSPKPKAKREKQLSCKKCGLTFEEFSRILRFGCEFCYESFSPALLELFSEIHGSTEYKGKSFKPDRERIGLLKRKNELQERLKMVVEEENFEEAARIRDELKDLEEKLR